MSEPKASKRKGVCRLLILAFCQTASMVAASKSFPDAVVPRCRDMPVGQSARGFGSILGDE